MAKSKKPSPEFPGQHKEPFEKNPLPLRLTESKRFEIEEMMERVGGYGHRGGMADFLRLLVDEGLKQIRIKMERKQTD